MSEPRTWYVLRHRRGPALVEGEDVFSHPGFSDHVAFLQSLAGTGRLVAAGPLGEVNGDGLTVLEADSLETARRLAEQEDKSVVEGVLAVTVRAWQIIMAPVAEG